MTDVPAARSTSARDDDNEAAEEVVEHQRNEMREFVATLSKDDIKSGNWFTHLLTHALSTYTDKVDWSYFQVKYAGVPADVIVDQRIKMAARYAALEGALSATAYTAAIAATIGSGGNVCLFTYATTHLIVDVNGIVAEATS